MSDKLSAACPAFLPLLFSASLQPLFSLHHLTLVVSATLTSREIKKFVLNTPAWHQISHLTKIDSSSTLPSPFHSWSVTLIYSCDPCFLSYRNSLRAFKTGSDTQLPFYLFFYKCMVWILFYFTGMLGIIMLTFDLNTVCLLLNEMVHIFCDYTYIDSWHSNITLFVYYFCMVHTAWIFFM